MLNFFFFSIRAAELALDSVIIAMRIRPNRLCHAFAFPWTPGRKNYEPLATFLFSISDVIMWTHLRLSIKKVQRTALVVVRDPIGCHCLLSR